MPLCAEPGEALTLEVVLINEGGTRSGGVSGVVEIPTAFTIQSASGCVMSGFRADASTWLCDGGTINALSSALVGEFRLIAPTTGASFSHRISLVGQDAGWTGLTAVTGFGVAPLDVTIGGRWDAGACQGTNIMSLSACMPGDLVYDTLQFLPDAAVISDDGIPSTWAQSASRRNLCFQSFGPLGGSIFRGESINARCFTGLTDRWVTGEVNFAAWITCY